MEFLVFRCKSDRDCFFVTNDAHRASLSGEVCPTDGDTLLRVGRFPELGDKRTAFNESAAKRAIEENGFYRFHSKTFDPVAEPPLAMP